MSFSKKYNTINKEALPDKDEYSAKDIIDFVMSEYGGHLRKYLSGDMPQRIIKAMLYILFALLKQNTFWSLVFLKEIVINPIAKNVRSYRKAILVDNQTFTAIAKAYIYFKTHINVYYNFNRIISILKDDAVEPFVIDIAADNDNIKIQLPLAWPCNRVINQAVFKYKQHHHFYLKNKEKKRMNFSLRSHTAILSCSCETTIMNHNKYDKFEADEVLNTVKIKYKDVSNLA